MTTLKSAVAAHPFPDYQVWWPMGGTFVRFMGSAIRAAWQTLPSSQGYDEVARYTDFYIQTVYDRDPRPNLMAEFLRPSPVIFSGEFDALSYAYFRSAFEAIAAHDALDKPAAARRAFTKQVGRHFYASLHHYLNLDLPKTLSDEASFRQLQTGIQRVGDFLLSQGYLRDHFNFHFTVDLVHAGKPLQQASTQFLAALKEKRIAYALYEMGYPAILPSAVYLYNTIGEAQHHSSRTIEELFDRVGYTARETDDFDPSIFPAHLVVELWEIKPSP